jgi:hypothetical protein
MQCPVPFAQQPYFIHFRSKDIPFAPLPTEQPGLPKASSVTLDLSWKPGSQSTTPSSQLLPPLSENIYEDPFVLKFKNDKIFAPREPTISVVSPNKSSKAEIKDLKN